MECGIFAIAGVLVGVFVSRKDIKISIARKKKSEKAKEENEKNKPSVAEQWENLLNYGGK